MSVDHVRIHPLSSFKRYWDLAIVVMVAYTVVALPVRCAFSWDYYHALDAGHNLFHQLAVRCRTSSLLITAAGVLCVILSAKGSHACPAILEMRPLRSSMLLKLNISTSICC